MPQRGYNLLHYPELVVIHVRECLNCRKLYQRQPAMPNTEGLSQVSRKNHENHVARHSALRKRLAL